MRRFITRTAAWALSITLALGAAVVPCAASDKAPAPSHAATAKLTHLSATSRQLLARAAAAPQQQQPPAAAPSSASSFFKSKRGAVTVALMGAGAGFALWSIQHDRKPVKSPVR